MNRFFADWTDQMAEPDAGKPASVHPPIRRRRLGRRWQATGALVLASAGVVAATAVIPEQQALADPSANDWFRLRMCESSNNYRINSGNGHYGAYQFDLPTWHSVGGRGYPQNASPAEQDARALILYRMRGWQPWQCASILGLQPDGDAGSGRISDIHVPTSGGHHRQHRHHPRSGVPRFPAGHSFVFGDWSNVIKRFQDQMHSRGAIPPGTGYYGPLTRAVVLRLQRENGIGDTGRLGPRTWRAAWTGTYHGPRNPGGTAPPFPGKSSFVFGDWSNAIKLFQDQMHSRGAIPPGTGYYGPLTRGVVLRLQRQNGIPDSGLLGPRTWRAAWEGKYHR